MSSPPPTAPPPARPWLEWALLAATAAPLLLLAYEAYRLVVGPVPAFTSRGEQDVGSYERLAYFQQLASPSLELILPLAGVAALAWLLRPASRLPDPGPLRRGALALTALLGLESAVHAGMSASLLVAREPGPGPASSTTA